MAMQEQPWSDVPVPVVERPQRRGYAAAVSGKEGPLQLSTAFAGGDCCEGCQLLLGSSSAKGDGEAMNDTDIIAAVEKELEVMSPWERIGMVFSWNQIGGKELEKGSFDEAGQAYIRALAYAQAFSNHGPLAASCASWAPAAMQQQEVRKWCGEVYIGMALLQLRREQADTHLSEDERALVLQKGEEAADRALELNPNSVEAHARLGLAKIKLAQLSRFRNERDALTGKGQAAIRRASQLREEAGQSASDELLAAVAEAAAL
eukprot:TRINITY_DN69181_c0_g1_i1.p1 TRINITY_DN69181_c0_g1~~TRINITY_DN69181_c0_g1_i1.p1  ORF type:complete len:277 (+),score=70.32 TRINITY_DN69181_c0_g1_i1:46-831(+)